MPCFSVLRRVDTVKTGVFAAFKAQPGSQRMKNFGFLSFLSGLFLELFFELRMSSLPYGPFW